MPTEYRYEHHIANRLERLDFEQVDCDRRGVLTLYDIPIATLTQHPTRPAQRLLEGPLGAMVCHPNDFSLFRPLRRLRVLHRYAAYAAARLRSPYIDDPEDVTRLAAFLDRLEHASLINRRRRPDGRRERFDAFMKKWHYDSLGRAARHDVDRTLDDIIETFRSEKRTYHTDDDVFLFGNLPLGYIEDGMLHTVIGRAPVTTNAYNAWMTCLLRLHARHRTFLIRTFPSPHDTPATTNSARRRNAQLFTALREIGTYYERNLNTCHHDPEIAAHPRSRAIVRQFISSVRRDIVREVRYSVSHTERPRHEDDAFGDTLRQHEALRAMMCDPRSVFGLTTPLTGEQIQVTSGRVYLKRDGNPLHVGYWFGGPVGFRDYPYRLEELFYGDRYAFVATSYTTHITTTVEDRIAEQLMESWQRLARNVEDTAAALAKDPTSYWDRDNAYKQVRWTDTVRAYTL